MAGLTAQRAQTALLHTFPWISYLSLHPWVVAASNERKVGTTEHAPVLSLVLKRCRVMSERRCHHDIATNVPEYTPNRSPKSAMAATGRESMVPQTMRVQFASLDDRAHSIALCQLLQC